MELGTWEGLGAKRGSGVVVREKVETWWVRSLRTVR